MRHDCMERLNRKRGPKVWQFRWSVTGPDFAQQEILAPLGLTKETLSMSRKKISSGVVHEVPADLKKALTSDPQALTAWEDITPLARNEWICWIESAKKAKTRSRRIEWGCSSLRDGKRRPCCWPGCAHR
jgi:Bacteriocin-protection, YdeI or OmpD-Associated